MSSPDFVPPPPPPPFNPQPDPPAEALSLAETLTGIFFEPGRVFESFRTRPRFLVALVIGIVFYMAFTFTFMQKVGYERVVRETIENGPRSEQMTAEQKETAIRMQSGPVFRVIGFVATPIVIVVIFLAGAGLYLLGAMLMSKQLTFKQSLAVWAYSAMPATILSMILNIILVFIRSPDDYDIVSASRRGLVKANLSFLSDPKTAPIVYTFLGSLDLFAFYGLFLAALGLRKVGKMTSGSAWGIVLGIWIFGLVVRISLAAIFGQGM